MKIAVTGTRIGMSHFQWLTFRGLLDKQLPFILEAHLGDCIGADADAHTLIVAMTRQLRSHVDLICHPPTNDKARAFRRYTREMTPKPYLDRNRDMVDACDHLYAFPKSTTEEKRGSGTWYTIRYARKVGRSLTIIWPDGSAVTEAEMVPLLPEIP